jgi:L-threonylcarbamoyladenylate synthase
MRVFKKIPLLKILQTSVFVYPTETCYGLGCDTAQPNLVKRIYQIKGRDFNKPVSWIVANLKMAKRYVNFSSKALELAKKFWPGPLTLVLPSKQKQKEMLALRVSSHPRAQSIVKKLNKPIVSTSANISRQSNCYTMQEVMAQFKNQEFRPDFIIDGGELSRCPPSTVARVIGDRVDILRQGVIVI